MALFFVFGLTCVGIGANWWIAGQPVSLAHFPASLAEACASVAGGLVVMLWAIRRMLGEITKQRPDRPAGQPPRAD